MSDWVLYHVLVGDLFFAGAAVCVVGAALSAWDGGRARVRTARLTTAVGFVCILASGTPLPMWVVVVLWGGMDAWLVAHLVPAALAPWLRTAMRVAPGVVALVALVVEAPYHREPTLPALGATRIVVVGDSLSAGIGEHARLTWPAQLQASRGVEITNVSRPGATAGSIFASVYDVVGPSGVTIIEIGGNDILGGTPVSRFTRDLTRVVQVARERSDLVLLLEMPVPPFRAGYGRVQRELARAPDVVLIPKRRLARLITADGMTVDGLHLSPAGHAAMAEFMGTLLQPVFAGVQSSPRAHLRPRVCRCALRAS